MTYTGMKGVLVRGSCEGLATPVKPVWLTLSVQAKGTCQWLRQVGTKGVIDTCHSSCP